MNKHLIKSTITICFTIVILLLGCSKSDNNNPMDENPTEETPNNALFYKLTNVRNFPGTIKQDGVNAAPTVLYSLDNNKAVTDANRQTNNWDIAFSDIFNSSISGNNGSGRNNYGFGNNATGGILIVEKPFDEVVDIPADSEFLTSGGAIGMDQNGDYGNGVGWLLYDFYGRIVRDYAEENTHVAYALGNGLKLKSGKEISPRTIIIRTAKGNYAKLKPLSMYKDQLSSSEWTKNSQTIFISFDYVLVPKGSKKFEIKP